MSSSWRLTVEKIKGTEGGLIVISMAHQFLMGYLFSFPYASFPNI